jgi:hypothetical protein
VDELAPHPFIQYNDPKASRNTDGLERMAERTLNFLFANERNERRANNLSPSGSCALSSTATLTFYFHDHNHPQP